MIPKAERDADAAILAAATPDWQQGHHVGEPKALCSAQSPDESLLMLDKDGMAIFWKEADATAAVTGRNRLPAYIEAAAEMERRIAKVEDSAVLWQVRSTNRAVDGDGENATLAGVVASELREALRVLRGGQ